MTSVVLVGRVCVSLYFKFIFSNSHVLVTLENSFLFTTMRYSFRCVFAKYHNTIIYKQTGLSECFYYRDFHFYLMVLLLWRFTTTFVALLQGNVKDMYQEFFFFSYLIHTHGCIRHAQFKYLNVMDFIPTRFRCV